MAESKCLAVERPAIFISLSMPDVSLLIYFPTTTHSIIYITHRVVNYCNLYPTFLCNSMTMASPLFNLHSTGHSSAYTCSSGLLSSLCSQKGPFFSFNTSRRLLSQVYNPLIFFINRTTLTRSSIINYFSVKRLCSSYTILSFISFILFR